jgi:hypothetical protein
MPPLKSLYGQFLQAIRTASMSSISASSFADGILNHFEHAGQTAESVITQGIYCFQAERPEVIVLCFTAAAVYDGGQNG